jgi:hypothetical protein
MPYIRFPQKPVYKSTGCFWASTLKKRRQPSLRMQFTVKVGEFINEKTNLEDAECIFTKKIKMFLKLID